MSSWEHHPDGQGRAGIWPTVFAGMFGAWLLIVVEFFVLAFGAGSKITGIWEAQMAGLGLLPSWLLLSVVPGALGGLVAHVSTSAAARPVRVQLSLGVTFFSLLVAYGVGGGRHLAEVQTRLAFALAVGAGAGVATFALAPFLARLSSSSRRLIVAGGVAIVVVETVNGSVLVRLYPAFHAGLSFAACVLAGWIIGSVWKRPNKYSAVVSTAILLGAIAGVLPGSRLVTGFDNFRWVVAEGSPTLNWGALLASQLAPPSALDASLAEVPLGERRRDSGVDLRGRDILLLSVDALRADHLGTYGYSRPTSPAMDALARDGVTFEAAYAPTPHTSYSITSLMTGKYMRPLLLQGAGDDSDLWATVLQAYDYRTAAFYPPAVFFIDKSRFTRFRKEKLGFEYAKIEFAEGDLRVSQVRDYLGKVPSGRRVFTWVHLFGPHEPYEADDRFDFGARDVDLYDSEVRAADDTVGRVIELARQRDPDVLIILTADHGEEFGDHGGRYHGTTVYDEQVRVPLIVAGSGLARGKRIQEPVQTIDLMPTVLSGLRIPIPPRIRGRDLSGHLEAGTMSEGEGRAVAETDDYTLLAQGKLRLVCQRRSGACQLYDIEADPHQLNDVSRQLPKQAEELRSRARSLAETHGQFESQGLRAEGKGWPSSILLGISGNAEVAPTLATLLDDADAGIRRKAAELLFTLADSAQAPALRLALTREEDTQTRAWLALALTRLGQGAPLVFELLRGSDVQMSRLAALALAEAGDDEGEDVLIKWWAGSSEIEHEQAERILSAFAQIRSKESVPYLVRSLRDVRLRPIIAQTLAKIGDKDAIAHLSLRLSKERFRSARLPLAQALVELGADEELIVPLRRFLGVPDRMEGALEIAQRAGILGDLGGPTAQERRRLEQLSDSGIRLSVVVPPSPSKGAQVRLVIRARSTNRQGGDILLEPAPPRIALKKGTVRSRNQPDIVSSQALRVAIPPGNGSEDSPFHEVHVLLPDRFNAKAGHPLGLELFAPGNVQVVALAAVPLRDDLAPPAPEPWTPGSDKKTPRERKPSESVQIPSP